MPKVKKVYLFAWWSDKSQRNLNRLPEGKIITAARLDSGLSLPDAVRQLVTVNPQHGEQLCVVIERSEAAWAGTASEELDNSGIEFEGGTSEAPSTFEPGDAVLFIDPVEQNATHRYVAFRGL